MAWRDQFLKEHEEITRANAKKRGEGLRAKAFKTIGDSQFAGVSLKKQEMVNGSFCVSWVATWVEQTQFGSIRRNRSFSSNLHGDGVAYDLARDVRIDKVKQHYVGFRN